MLLTISQFLGSFSVPDSRYTNSPFFWIQTMEGHSGQKCNLIATCIPLDRIRVPMDRTFLPFNRTSIPFDRTFIPLDRTFHPFDRTSIILSLAI